MITKAQAHLLNKISGVVSDIRTSAAHVAQKATDVRALVDNCQRPTMPGFTVLGQAASDLERSASQLEALLEVAYGSDLPSGLIFHAFEGDRFFYPKDGE